MAQMFSDPMYVFPVDSREARTPGAITSPMQTPGQTSMTGVFAGPPTPSLGTTVSGMLSPGLDAAAARERVASRSPCGDNVISVVTREGDELHYPVVHARAGGSIVTQSGGCETGASNAATRAEAAARAHRHASLLSVSSHNTANGGAAGDGEEEETAAEMAETYQQSRATPSSIRRHRHGSRGCSRSPPPSVALRGEPVEDTVRATTSAANSMGSSLATTPRMSIQRSPECTPLHDLGGGGGRHSQALVDGVSVRVEETGVSTPEMAEYFAEGAVDAHLRSSSAFASNALSASASASQVGRRAFVTPRHSQHFGTAVPTGTHPAQSVEGVSGSGAAVSHGIHLSVLDRLMQLMEEQSKVSQQLLSRMDDLESTNKALVDRLDRIETAVESRPTREEVVARVSAESASPSVTRTSGSMDSSARPSTRAPSKAVS